jgi:hypothetical protein
VSANTGQAAEAFMMQRILDDEHQLPGGTASAQARVELKKADESQLWPDSRLSTGEDRNASVAQQGSAHDHLASRLDKNTN